MSEDRLDEKCEHGAWATDCPCCLRHEIYKLTQELANADRRAGAAERKLEQEIDTSNRRDAWLRQAKKDWGVDTNTSFDVIWAECKRLKSRALLPVEGMEITCRVERKIRYGDAKRQSKIDELGYITMPVELIGKNVIVTVRVVK